MQEVFTVTYRDKHNWAVPYTIPCATREEAEKEKTILRKNDDYVEIGVVEDEDQDN